ncbi:hypothetical protein ACOME3_003097 [Neoechinorhynchus agilis]
MTDQLHIVGNRAPSGFADLDVSVQRAIEKRIRETNIARNMELAFEHFPETFALVTMLFIDCKVNNHALKAFVDTGAQMTIMSKSCAERCGLMHLVDERFRGLAMGVGSQVIVGRVHIAQLEIANVFVNATFNILSEQAFDVIIGLDLLKRHQCSVDLEQNCLFVKVDQKRVRANFLPERDLPDVAKQMFNSNQSGRLQNRP